MDSVQMCLVYLNIAMHLLSYRYTSQGVGSIPHLCRLQTPSSQLAVAIGEVEDTVDDYRAFPVDAAEIAVTP